MLVQLPFHNHLFQNGSQDFPNFNLVQIRGYRCMCCMLQQYLLEALCQSRGTCVCAVIIVVVFMIPV